jgi:hypothetical protein
VAGAVLWAALDQAVEAGPAEVAEARAVVEAIAVSRAGRGADRHGAVGPGEPRRAFAALGGRVALSVAGATLQACEIRAFGSGEPLEALAQPSNAKTVSGTIANAVSYSAGSTRPSLVARAASTGSIATAVTRTIFGAHRDRTSTSLPTRITDTDPPYGTYSMFTTPVLI